MRLIEIYRSKIMLLYINIIYFKGVNEANFKLSSQTFCLP